MKDRIDRAADILRGYCAKTDCGKCRFGTPEGNCDLQDFPPCDWGQREKLEQGDQSDD